MDSLTSIEQAMIAVSIGGLTMGILGLWLLWPRSRDR